MRYTVDFPPKSTSRTSHIKKRKGSVCLPSLSTTFLAAPFLSSPLNRAGSSPPDLSQVDKAKIRLAHSIGLTEQND
ncbi:MAG: hypothetical protein LBF22_00010 [Deltaproteobacteria bacterium]|nr:hypothetical protein [Deltaproteobacteria bacterium]